MASREVRRTVPCPSAVMGAGHFLNGRPTRRSLLLFWVKGQQTTAWILAFQSALWLMLCTCARISVRVHLLFHSDLFTTFALFGAMGEMLLDLPLPCVVVDLLIMAAEDKSRSLASHCVSFHIRYSVAGCLVDQKTGGRIQRLCRGSIYLPTLLFCLSQPCS
jgi:hypothetical protein